MKGAKVAVKVWKCRKLYSENVQGQGATIVAVGEWAPSVGTYALYNEDGLDFADMKAYMDEHKNLVGYPKAKQISLDEFWGIRCRYTYTCSFRKCCKQLK